MLKARIWATAEQLQDTALKDMFDSEGSIDCTLPELAQLCANFGLSAAATTSMLSYWAEELAEAQRSIGFEQGLAAAGSSRLS